MRGVPRITDMKALMTARTGANLDLRSIAITIPSGSDPMRVRMKIRKVLTIPWLIVDSIVEKVIKIPLSCAELHPRSGVCYVKMLI